MSQPGIIKSICRSFYCSAHSEAATCVPSLVEWNWRDKAKQRTVEDLRIKRFLTMLQMSILFSHKIFLSTKKKAEGHHTFVAGGKQAYNHLHCYVRK